jgi:hypothetical protein
LVVVLHEAAGPQAWVASKFWSSLQTAVPVEQSSFPVLHAFVGGQELFCTQAWQAGVVLVVLLQTPPVHADPGVMLAKVPSWPPVLLPRQERQICPQAPSQHTPSTQFPFLHWFWPPHLAPLSSFAVHTPDAQ